MLFSSGTRIDYEFEFEKGAVITSSLNLVKIDALVYRIFNEMLAGAHVPWYIGYNEMACRLDGTKYHAAPMLAELRPHRTAHVEHLA
ncbi:hypothetical protein [Paraburkholderia sp. J76]|uniref:hypothetical protein n=1 Tax=Paraburkholderia sp. J76 TaxID=2805439 RepID=UPI002ABD1E7C|nr:hypothetical protein [Paraburkholderia sp. J76]